MELYTNISKGYGHFYGFYVLTAKLSGRKKHYLFRGNRNACDVGGIVYLDRVDLPGNRSEFELGNRSFSQDFLQPFSVLVFWVQPGIICIRMHDRWHAVVNIFQA